jgi:BlaI family transcriptional regulator, penicillinase repressor
MSRKAVAVSETELAILEVLWDRDRATVREIVESIYGKHTASLHATVNSLIDRLREKGYVAVDPSGFAHRYSVTVDRDAIVGQRLKEIADQHFQGAVAPLLLTLIDQVKLSRKDREAITRIIGNIRDSH